jgi:hypothetical protein
MRNVLLTLSLTIAIGTTVHVTSNISAWAQAGCQLSCSGVQRECIRRGTPAEGCAVAYQKCLKSGVWIGPKTGVAFYTNVCKK